MNGKIEAVRSHELVEVNEPSSFWVAPIQVWRNVLRYRFLVASFIQRDLRIKYRNSALGYLWSLVEPLLLTATYYLLFVVVAGRPEARYSLWVIIGVITWQFFGKTLNSAVGSLTQNAGMIKQVYFPREIFAITTAGSNAAIACLSMLVALPFLLHFGVSPDASVVNLWMVPAGLLLAGLLALGIGLAMACLNAVHRDVEHFFKFFTRAGFYLSPVMWTVDQAASREAVVDKLLYNPMVVPISLIRNGVQGEPLTASIQPVHIGYSVAVCVGCFVVGCMFFKRFEAEVVKNV